MEFHLVCVCVCVWIMLFDNVLSLNWCEHLSVYLYCLNTFCFTEHEIKKNHFRFFVFIWMYIKCRSTLNINKGTSKTNKILCILWLLRFRKKLYVNKQLFSVRFRGWIYYFFSQFQIVCRVFFVRSEISVFHFVKFLRRCVKAIIYLFIDLYVENSWNSININYQCYT